MPKRTDTEDLAQRLRRITELFERVGWTALGNRFQRLRQQHGMSIRALAEKSDVNKSSIVRFEQGRGSHPTTVLRLCNALDIHVERLATTDDAEGRTVAVHRHRDDRWYDLADVAGEVLQGDRHLSSPTADVRNVQVAVCMLQSRLLDGRVLPALLDLRGASQRRSHAGEEFVYVLRGKVRIDVGGEQHVLAEGESMTFWSAEPHSYAPAGRSRIPPRVLSVRVNG